MKINWIEIDGTPSEIDSSAAVSELLARRISDAAFRESAAAAAPAPSVDANDAIRRDVDGAANPGEFDSALVPGVAEEGQATVQQLLQSNGAAGAFRRFLYETASWPNVRVHGVKRKGSSPGDPLDYSRYLRLRKQGSNLGGFAYVWALDGTVNFRLHFSNDAELAAVAPDAWRLHSGNQEYRVSVKIADEATRTQALALARLAYEKT